MPRRMRAAIAAYKGKNKKPKKLLDAPFEVRGKNQNRPPSIPGKRRMTAT